MDEHNNAKALMKVNCGIKQYIKFSFRLFVFCFYILGCLGFFYCCFVLCCCCYFRGFLLFVIRFFNFLIYFCKGIKQYIKFSFRLFVVCFYILGCLIFIVDFVLCCLLSDFFIFFYFFVLQ